MTVLTCTVHDPDAGLLWITKEQIFKLKKLFPQIIIVSSPMTNPSLLSFLRENDCQVIKRKDNSIGRTYFEAVRQASKINTDYIFYCDFDRILHFCKNFNDELQNLVKFLEKKSKSKDKIDYIICERTKAGYMKHHEALYLSEQLPNQIISLAMRENKQHDYLGGAFILSKRATKLAVAQGGTKGMQFWGLWPVMMRKNKMKILYKTVSGLEWETPNQYQEAIKLAGGLEKWKENLSTPNEWKRRTIIAREAVEMII